MGRDVAEDLAQETLVVLEEKYRHVGRVEELLPLSLQIVRLKMSALRRKTVRRGEYTSISVEDTPLPDGAQARIPQRRRARTRTSANTSAPGQAGGLMRAVR